MINGHGDDQINSRMEQDIKIRLKSDSYIVLHLPEQQQGKAARQHSNF